MASGADIWGENPKRTRTLTVWHDGNALSLLPETAQQLGLRDHQSIDETTLWRVLDLNTAAIRAREDRRPGGDPAIRKQLARCLDETEKVVARHYAKAEGR